MTANTAPAWDGLPENPEKSGPHWVAYLDPDMPPDIARWNGTSWDEREVPPQKFAEAWHYLGPAHTPAEVSALVEAARREGSDGLEAD